MESSQEPYKAGTLRTHREGNGGTERFRELSQSHKAIDRASLGTEEDKGQNRSLIDYGPFSQFRDAHEQVNAPGCRFQVDLFGLVDTESWLHKNMLYKMI